MTFIIYNKKYMEMTKAMSKVTCHLIQNRLENILAPISYVSFLFS